VSKSEQESPETQDWATFSGWKEDSDQPQDDWSIVLVPKGSQHSEEPSTNPPPADSEQP